jgi:hypothetical protein
MPKGMRENVSRAWSDIQEELGRHLSGSPGAIPLKFYREFEDEWQTYSDGIRQELGRFLRLLQNDPCSPRILSRSEQTERYYAYRLEGCGAVVYWKLEVKGVFITISTPPQSICILAIEFNI